MDKFTRQLPFLVLLIISSFAIIFLFPRAHPLGGIRLPLDATSIEERSRDVLQSLGVETQGAIAQAQLRTNDRLLRQLMQIYGIEKANDMLSRGLYVHMWDVTWKRPANLKFSSGERQSSSKEEEQISEILRGTIFTRLNPNGKVIEYQRKLADSAAFPSLNETEARELAMSFLKRYGAAGVYVPDTVQPAVPKRTEQKNRVDFEFVLTAQSPYAGNPSHISIVVTGNIVSRYEEEITVPAEFRRTGLEQASNVALPIVYALIVLSMIVVAFRRFRSFELGFRLSAFIATISSVMLAVEIYVSYGSSGGWEMLIPLILGPLFYGGGLVLTWAVGESITRETWKEKLIPFDLLSKGFGIHSRVGEACIRGIALGAAAFVALLLLVYIAGSFTPLWVSAQGDEGSSRIFGSLFSWLTVLGHGVSANAYALSLIFLFALSFLRKRIASTFLLVILGALITTLTSSEHLSPFWIGYPIETLVAAIVVWAFCRYDALVAFLSLFTITVLEGSGSLLVSGTQTYVTSGTVALTALSLTFVAGFGLLLRKQELTEFDDIMPAFAKHITERQRLQQELEIARSVQMSFLPKANPRIVELDIASRCAPALEVGGDYYDFITLKEKRLGVVVGDVSGKGTQAAFFMTLTKGFVHALAEVSGSPSAVLTQVNKLFYENVDRGVFISMVYGIFDTRRNVLTLARAGHNPVIMRKTQSEQAQVVNPMGLALGLDAGETFAKSIQEVTIPFQSGDLFVFYTDGFPEAMNKTMEEFGEDRLCQTVQKYARGTAAEIMDGVFAEMKQFVGKAKQHDDMTIVVVKIV
jgi:hypothetical protein